jgi:putative oxidoreductase
MQPATEETAVQYATHPPAMPVGRASLREQALSLGHAALRGLDGLAPLLDLGIRLYVANIFFSAGLTKIASWDTTLALFENEYAVPLLSPQWAALLGTAGELVLPVLLVLGLGGRIAALGLFIVNAVAVVAYPDIGDVGLADHQVWGLLLLVTLLHGPGALSLDRLLARFATARRVR